MRKLLISLGLVVCLLMAFALPMCAPAPAPPVEEEKPPVEEEAPPVEEELAKSILAYMTIGDDNNKVVIDFIKEKLGVEVKVSDLSCGEVYARLEAEAPRFATDMVMYACAPEAMDAREKGWSVAYDSPNWRDAGPVFKDPDNYWWNLGNFHFVLNSNPDMLAEAGYTMPQSWDELLDPKWKGEIVMPSPLTSGTAYMILYSLMTEFGFNRDKGEEGGWEYLEALDKNIHHYVSSGSAPLELVARGEFLLGISSDSLVLRRLEEGYPVIWTIPKEGTGYGMNSAFILKGTKELYTCQKIVDLLGTKEFAELMSATTGYVSKEPDVISAFYGSEKYPCELALPGGIPRYISNIDIGWAIENRVRLLDEWKERIGRVPAE